MSDQWMKMSFVVSDRVLGCDVLFHDGGSVRIGADQTRRKLFRETRTRKRFDTYQMISNVLMKSNTRKQDLILPAAAAEAFEKGICVGKPSLDMNCTPGSVELMFGKKARDIKRIIFDVELTVRPQKQS